MIGIDVHRDTVVQHPNQPFDNSFRRNKPMADAKTRCQKETRSSSSRSRRRQSQAQQPVQVQVTDDNCDGDLRQLLPRHRFA